MTVSKTVDESSILSAPARMSQPDEQLIKDYLSGDEKSLEILIKQYLKPIYGFVYKYIRNVQESEDITQDVFVKVWRHLKRFDRKKSFKTWIFSIAKNTCIDWIRKKKTMLLDDKFAETLINQAPLASENLEKTDIFQVLVSAMDNLLPKYQTVLSLRYNDNLNFREIAVILKESINTIKSRHRRALNMLKKNLI